MATAVTETTRQVRDLEIGPLEPRELDEAVAVLARGMRDNPLHIAAYGEDPEQRYRRIAHLFGRSARQLAWDRHMVVARDMDGTIVGVCGMTAPGACVPRPADQVRMLPTLLGLGPRTALRVMRWLGVWSKRDLATPHWHVGPLAVDADLQGQGIGSDLMRVFCARMDAAGADAYLETDKAVNVRFYHTFGFEVIGA